MKLSMISNWADFEEKRPSPGPFYRLLTIIGDARRQLYSVTTKGGKRPYNIYIFPYNSSLIQHGP